MATKYGTLENGILALAPRAIVVNGAMVTNPKAEHFAALNEERAKQGLPLYYPISDDPAPTPPEGKVVQFNGYAVVHGWIAPQYSFEDAPPLPPRTFSKYKLVGALMQAQVWPQVKEWLLAQDGAYDLYLAAEDISEDEPLLALGIAAAKELLGWTDEQVEEVLQEAMV